MSKFRQTRLNPASCGPTSTESARRLLGKFTSSQLLLCNVVPLSSTLRTSEEHSLANNVELLQSSVHVLGLSILSSTSTVYYHCLPSILRMAGAQNMPLSREANRFGSDLCINCILLTPCQRSLYQRASFLKMRPPGPRSCGSPKAWSPVE